MVNEFDPDDPDDLEDNRAEIILEKLTDFLSDPSFHRSEITEEYFEGELNKGYFDDPSKTDDEKASCLLWLFEMVRILSMTDEQRENLEKTVKDLPLGQKLGMHFMKAKACAREAWAFKKGHGFITQQQYKRFDAEEMKLYDRYYLPSMVKMVSKISLMAALPLDDEMVKSAADVAQIQGFQNFAKLLQERLQIKIKPMHERYERSLRAKRGERVSLNLPPLVMH